MDNSPVDFFGAEGKLTRWLRILKTPTKKTQLTAEKQAIGVLLMSVGAASIALVLAAFVFVVFIAPTLPASTSSLAKSEEAAALAATAFQNFLPGHEVRVERRFAYNLTLYVDRKSFENIPSHDRKAMMAKIKRLWCDNIGEKWLARLSVFDIVSGRRLEMYICAFGK
jgi:hypothetical protein